LKERAAIKCGVLMSKQRGVQSTLRRSQAGDVAGGSMHPQLRQFAGHPQPDRTTSVVLLQKRIVRK